ncbi:hypothetical protein CEXT_357251 [Caerostris extrusa]|uniref:Uncharacterized protein n=1 Tax=Caerostris extrusa TaxID=172846 RepID=A0AAV4SXE0_CAEEX|nr:hypothetical protein CEXT_357251 [Caerostris extrusa]
MDDLLLHEVEAHGDEGHAKEQIQGAHHQFSWEPLSEMTESPGTKSPKPIKKKNVLGLAVHFTIQLSFKLIQWQNLK